MHGIAKRIENRSHIQIDIRLVMPHIGHRERNVFGESARPIDADPFGIGARRPAPGEAVAAASANNVPLAANDLTWEKIGHVRAYLDDFTYELVPYDHGHRDSLFRPGVPFVNVNVCAADARAVNLD